MDQDSSIRKWEYCTLQYRDGEVHVTGSERNGVIPNEPIETALNNFGEYGWEVVGITTDETGITHHLKRPRQIESATA